MEQSQEVKSPSPKLSLRSRRNAEGKTQVLKRFQKRSAESLSSEDRRSDTASPSDLAPQRPPRSNNSKRDLSQMEPRQGRKQTEGKKRFIKREDCEVIDLHQHKGILVGLSHQLEIVDTIEQGAFVDAKEHGRLFVPKSQLPRGVGFGDTLRIFLYRDGERVLATCHMPSLQLGMIGNLKVNSIEGGTAYLEMGIPKELVVPVSEQRTRFVPHTEQIVLVAIDEQGRLFGTQRFNRYIRERAYPNEFKNGQSVKVVAFSRTQLGYKVVVDDKVYGLIFANEQRGELIMGKRYDGYIVNTSGDGRLSVSLQASGQAGDSLAAFDILKALYYSHGSLPFNDRTDPRVIADYLHISKARFKRAIGFLYKEHWIVIKEDGIELTAEGNAKFEEEQHRALQQKNTTPFALDDE